MRSLPFLAGCVLALSSAAACSDASSPVLPDAPARSVNSLAVQFFTAPGYIGVEQMCTWEVLVSGGQSPYTYTWTTDGSWSAPGGSLEEVDSSLGSMFVGRATSTGTYYLTVTVTDAAGRSGSSTATGEVGLFPNRNYPCDM